MYPVFLRCQINTNKHSYSSNSESCSLVFQISCRLHSRLLIEMIFIKNCYKNRLGKNEGAKSHSKRQGKVHSFKRFFWQHPQIEHFETPVSQSQLLPQGIKLCTHVSCLNSWHRECSVQPCTPAAEKESHSASNKIRLKKEKNKKLVDSQTASTLEFFKLKICFYLFSFIFMKLL